MTRIKEQLELLRKFLKTDFRKMIRWTAIAMVLFTLFSFVVGLVSPVAVENALNAFTNSTLQAGIVDDAGNLLLFPLLANNWRAMIITALYGLAPFIYLPIMSLALNSALLGVMAGYYQTSGLSLAAFVAGVLPHGIFELPALVLSVSCGVYLCRQVSFWFIRYDQRTPVPRVLEDLLRVMLFLVLPLSAAAAVMEVYVTPAIMGLFL